MKEVWVGIDPGSTGAVAVIDKEDKIIDILDYEALILENSLLITIPILKKKYDVQLITLEKLNASACFSKRTNWVLSGNYHIWETAANLSGVEVSLYLPRAWQKGLFEKRHGEKKQRSLNLCRELYPEYNDTYFKFKKDHDRADAVLIARHGKTKWMDTKK